MYEQFPIKIVFLSFLFFRNRRFKFLLFFLSSSLAATWLGA